MPIAKLNIIISKRALTKLKSNFFFFACFKEYLSECTKLFFRSEDGGFFIGNINLHDFGTVNITGVFNFKRNLKSIRVLNIACGKLHIAVFKCCVGKTVAKREKNLFFGRVIISVADINAFFMF